jgi:hypothetical protein
VSHGVDTELHSFLLNNYDDCYKEATFIMSRQIYLIMTLLHQELTSSILKCAYKVHSALGPGLLESAYEECLHYELYKAGLEIC